FSKDGLSSNATKLGTPLMLDSYTSIYACNLRVFGHVHEECPKNIGAGVTNNLKKTSQTPKGILVRQKMGFKPKHVFQPVSKKSNANTCGKRRITQSILMRFRHLEKYCRVKKARNNTRGVQQANVFKEDQVDNEHFFMVWHLDKHLDSLTWLMDSGCTSRMTPERFLFISLNTKDNPRVKLGDGCHTRAKGRGTIAINTNKGTKYISRVLYVPELDRSMLRMPQMIKNGYGVNIKNDSRCVITDSRDVKIATLDMKNDSYYLKFDVTDASAFSVTEDDSMKWHKRFGHFNYGTLQHMYSTKLVRDMPSVSEVDSKCEGCELGKSRRLPFSKVGVTRVTHKLEIMHSDICGPMSTASWSIQSGSTLRILRTDNGGEYTLNEFEDFIRQQGVIHQVTVPYSPQQNSISERKNRTVIEMARSMLYEKKLPKTFWAEAIATSVYLLNILATKAVSGKTPIEAWSRIKPSIQHLKVFRSISYYHIPDINRSKLGENARKGIFVGYATESRGYRINDLTYSKIVISRDVTFDEGAYWKWNMDEVKRHEDTFLNEMYHDEVDIPEFDIEDTTGTDVLRTRPLVDVYESCNSVIKPESYMDGSKLSEWIDAMKAELEMIKKNNTWKLLDLLERKNAMVRNSSESTLYMKQFNSKERLIISLYVDDLLVIGSNDHLVKEFKKQMESEFDIQFLSRFMGEPFSSHLGAAKRVLRYVKGSLDLGIMFERNKVVKLEGYADSDWARSIDDSKSTSVVGAVNHVIWIRKLLFDFDLTQEGPTVIFCDNKSTIAIAKNPVQHGRTNHINVKYHAIREAGKNEVKLKYCTSETQLADMLTKSSSKLTRDQTSNPTSSTNTTPKGRTRRSSKQKIENSNFEEHLPPVATMADNRTMAEMLRAPIEWCAEAIVVLPILAEQFELKHSLINMMTSEQFFGLEKDNSHDHIRWWQFVGKKSSRCVNDHRKQIQVNQQTSDVTTAMTAMLKQLQAIPPSAPVKAVEEICVTCKGAHLYYQCLAACGNTFPEFRDNIQGYVSAAAGNYNQGNPGYRLQGVANQMRPPGSGSLPSNTVANPKGELKAITTRSGLVIDGPIVPTPPKSVTPEVGERVEETYTDPDLAEYTIKVPPPPV
nr:retrovirus-related Pol polyprotein from transposon TNT 1-94 [Tanacetum cinerariifolium]